MLNASHVYANMYASYVYANMYASLLGLIYVAVILLKKIRYLDTRELGGRDCHR